MSMVVPWASAALLALAGCPGQRLRTRRRPPRVWRPPSRTSRKRENMRAYRDDRRESTTMHKMSPPYGDSIIESIAAHYASQPPK